MVRMCVCICLFIQLIWHTHLHFYFCLHFLLSSSQTCYALTFMRCGEMASFLCLSILSDQISFFCISLTSQCFYWACIQHHIAIVLVFVHENKKFCVAILSPLPAFRVFVQPPFLPNKTYLRATSSFWFVLKLNILSKANKNLILWRLGKWSRFTEQISFLIFTHKKSHLHLLMNGGNEHIAMVIIILQLKNSENKFFKCLNWFSLPRFFSLGLCLTEMSLFVVCACVHSMSCLLCSNQYNCTYEYNFNVHTRTQENLRLVCVICILCVMYACTCDGTCRCILIVKVNVCSFDRLFVRLLVFFRLSFDVEYAARYSGVCTSKNNTHT